MEEKNVDYYILKKLEKLDMRKRKLDTRRKQVLERFGFTEQDVEAMKGNKDDSLKHHQ